ncbi:hypothetical protein [Microbulbifer sp. TRSA007]|uniref:hypothetical protein n=1 Tax=Microbulbifer sp. TRSA007 TaxID=3243384 RepID=UPI0040393F09
MMKGLRKRNSDYSSKERVSYSIVFIVVAFSVSFLLAGSSLESSIVQYIVALFFGVSAGLVGYKYPKAVYILILALPLSLVGS